VPRVHRWSAASRAGKGSSNHGEAFGFEVAVVSKDIFHPIGANAHKRYGIDDAEPAVAAFDQQIESLLVELTINPEDLEQRSNPSPDLRDRPPTSW